MTSSFTRLFSSFTPSMIKRRSIENVTPASSLKLPRLPIPSLRHTLNGYLKSLEPFILEDEARSEVSFQTTMDKYKARADQFEQGLGQLCQQRLLELEKNSPYNWLDDNFWLDKVYLEQRAPLVINSNWWLAYENDRNVPAKVRDNDHDEERAGISAWQIRRAAWLLSRTLDFKERIENQEEDTLSSRTDLWLRNTVPTMFNVCRVPDHPRDHLIKAGPGSPFHKRVIILLLDWVYSIDAYDDGAKNVGYIELENRIRDVVVDVEKRLLYPERTCPVCVLTAGTRNQWAENYKYLTKLSNKNIDTLLAIQQSLMVVSLDSYTYKSKEPFASELKSHLHNIRSGRGARNRWFDKGTTLIVETNTRAGMMGEHSPVDALVPSIVADHSLSLDIDEEWPMERFHSYYVSGSSTAHPFMRHDFVTDDYISTQCEETENQIKSIIEDSDDNVFSFEDFGFYWIREIAYMSPDSFVQMAMQLAWYKTRGMFTATYETALTRLFLHGRTETIRSLTADARLFVLAMVDPKASSVKRYELLKKACTSHASLTKAASLGKGIDRHLMGLSLVMKDDESSPLFDDLFSRSQEWKLSTSGLSAGMNFRGTGFGSPYYDGYGINYMIAPNTITFGIESKFSCKETSTEQFKNAIFSSLRQMHDICNLHLNKEISQRSRL